MRSAIGLGDAAADQAKVDQQQRDAASAEIKLAQGKQLTFKEQNAIAIGFLGGAAMIAGGPGLAALVTSAWELGVAALNALADVLGRAGPGDGTCYDGTHQFIKWNDPSRGAGGRIAPPATDFERFAQPLLGRAWEVENNCGPALDRDKFVHHLADVWNRTHAGPAHTYVKYEPKDWQDTDALLGFVKTPMPVNTGGPSGSVSQRAPIGGLAPANEGLSTGAKVAIAVPVAAAAGTAIYAWLTHQAFSTVVKKLLRKVGGDQALSAAKRRLGG